MVTLGIGLMLFEAANKAAFITGGVDGLSGMVMGKLFGTFEFDLYGKTAFCYSLACCSCCSSSLRRLVHSPFGLSLRGIREGARRMPAIGANVDRRLLAVFTIGAAIAGVAGALLAQTTQFVGLDIARLPALGRAADHAGAGRHRPPVRRAGRRGRLHAGAGLPRRPQSGLLAVLARPAAGA